MVTIQRLRDLIMQLLVVKVDHIVPWRRHPVDLVVVVVVILLVVIVEHLVKVTQVVMVDMLVGPVVVAAALVQLVSHHQVTV
jgi:hypothetical protein